MGLCRIGVSLQYVYLLESVGVTGKRYIGSQIEAVGSNIVYAWLEQSNTSQNVSLADQISVGDMNAIREGVPDAEQVAGTNDIPMDVIANRQVRPVRLIGVTQGFQQIRRLIILQGRYFDDADFSTLFITARTTLYRVRLGVKGASQN